jgi:DNA-binding phage protein
MRNTLSRPEAGARAQVRSVQHVLAKDATNIAQIAKAAGVQRQTVYRVKADLAAGEAALLALGG